MSCTQLLVYRNGRCDFFGSNYMCYCRGVGKWILKQMQGFFQTDSGPSEIEDLTKKGKFSSIKAN